MRFLASLRLASLLPALVAASLPLACGDDDGTDDANDTAAQTSTIGSTDDDSTSTGASSSSTGADTSSSTNADSTGSTAASSSSDDDSTTGPVGDPAYPPPDGGQCPDGYLPVALPGAEICAPFCGGPDDACPTPATGNPMPFCTPFAGAGGSGDPCEESRECPDGETCNDGACAEIAFFACQLFCGMGEACPDGMECSGISTCGYP